MAFPPVIRRQPNTRADALAKMQDTLTIKQAGAPQGQTAQAPTLGRPMTPPAQIGQASTKIDPPKRTDIQMPGAPVQPPRPMPPAPMPTPTVTPQPAPPPPPVVPKTPEEQQADLDQQIRDFVSGRIAGAGDVDTTEQEDLIRQMIEGKTGESLVDQRARMGRAGFGASGAMGAIEGDVMRQAGQAASGDILDLRRNEEQRSFDNASKAIQTEQGMRSAASDEAIRRMILETLQAQAGLEPDGDGGAADGPFAGGALPADISGSESPTIPANGGASNDSAIPVSAPPAGSTPVPGQPGVYTLEKGKYSDGSPRIVYYKVQQ